MRFTINSSEQFRSRGRDGFNDYFNEFDFPYAGFNLGVNYILNSSEKNLFSVGISCNGIFIIDTGFGYGLSSTTTSGVRKKLVSANFEIENDERFLFLILPQVEFAYHRRLGHHLSFKGAIVGAFSNKNYLNATYTIHGDNLDLDGSFTKKLNHVGISAGLIYSLEKRVDTP